MSAPQSHFSLTLRIRDEPETLDWNLAHTVVESDLLMNLMEGLVTYDSNQSDSHLKISPALAQSWSISPDGKTYVFKIRPGVKWSDGVALRAQDFVFSWKRLLSPVTAASYAYLLFDIEGAEAFHAGTLQDFNQVGIQATDDHTLMVHLKRPVASWLNIPAFWATFPLREDVVEKYGSSWDSAGRMVNLGPFSIASHDQDSKFVLKANPLYYGRRGNLKEIVAKIVKDDATAIALYEEGKLDLLTDLSWVDRKRMKPKLKSDLKVFKQFKTGFLGFVVDKFPVSDVHLRRAIAQAIDKNQLVRRLGGGQEAATSFVPPGLTGYSKKLGLHSNAALAKQELHLSGILADGTLSLGYVLPNWDKSVIIARFIQDELLKKLGLHVTLEPLDNQAYRSQLDLHGFGLFDYTWTADFPDPDNFLSLFTSSSGNSRTHWKNKTFDDSIRSARESRSTGEREKLYLRAQKLLLEEEAVVVPLYYEPILALVSCRVENLHLNAMDYLYLKHVSVENCAVRH